MLDPLGNRIGEPDECPQPESCRMTNGPTHRHSMIDPVSAGEGERAREVVAIVHGAGLVSGTIVESDGSITHECVHAPCDVCQRVAAALAAQDEDRIKKWATTVAGLEEKLAVQAAQTRALREALERILTRYAVAHYKYNEGTFDFFLCRYCEHDDGAPQTAEAITHSVDCPVTIAGAALTGAPREPA